MKTAILTGAFVSNEYMPFSLTRIIGNFPPVSTFLVPVFASIDLAVLDDWSAAESAIASLDIPGFWLRRFTMIVKF